MNKYLFAAVVVLLVVIGTGFYYSRESQPLMETPNPASTTTASSAPALPSVALQSAVHLDIYINGIPAPVPQISTTTASGQQIAMDMSGVITFAPPLAAGETLGRVFAAIGQTLTPTCLGTFCASASNSFRIYVNGKLYQGDPRQIPLTQHEEIAIVYGTASQIPNPVPSSYSF